MAHYVLDSYAMLAFFRNEQGRDIIEKLLNEAAAAKHTLYMTCINVGEVYYMACRKDGVAKATIVWNALQEFPITIIDADLTLTHKAALLKATNKISYADAFAAAITIQKKATLITGDHEFDALLRTPHFKVKYL